MLSDCFPRDTLLKEVEKAYPEQTASYKSLLLEEPKLQGPGASTEGGT